MEIKELRFETSKGKFFIVENSQSVLRHIPHDFCNRIGLLSGLTEEQASDIVDYPVQSVEFQGGGFYDTIYNYVKVDFQLGSSNIDSLVSLIESEGWYLENTYGNNDDTGHNARDREWQQAESRTLNNPVIFKIK